MEAATLDGEDQWTCTAASSTEVPEKDESYSRTEDPFQLKNVITDHSETARDLFDQLREFMAEIKVT